MNLLKKYISVTYKNKHRIINFFGIKFKTKFDCYDLTGTNNKIILVSEDGHEKILKPNEKIPGIDIRIDGDNNLVIIHEPIIFNNSILWVEHNNCKFKIGKSKYEISALFHLSAPNTKIIIGDNLSTGSGTQINGFSTSNTSVTIGNDCMFSFGVIIRPDDGHVITDNKTNKIINYGKNITIGNHVWLGEQCLILKGSNIPDNSIVGAKSLVNKNFSKNDEGGIILAGQSAKIIKRNINWTRLPQWYFEKQNENERISND